MTRSSLSLPSSLRSAWGRRSWTLRVIGLLLLATATGGGAAEHAAKAVTAEHPAAVAMKAALDNGTAFEMRFSVLPPAANAEAKDRQERAVSRALRRLRSDLPAKPAYEFRAGVEFALAATNEKLVTVRQPVGDEKADEPSVFRLAPAPLSQVYLVFRVSGGGERTWRLHALMLPAEGGWKSGGLTLIPTSIGKMDAEGALAAAQKEAAAGRPVLALALFGLANELGTTPRYRTSAFAVRLPAAYDPVAKQLGLPEKPVATVETPGGKFALSYANARVYEKGAYLLLFREAPLRERPADSDAHQRQLAAAFLKSCPELKAYFVGIAINERYTDPRGVERDDRSLTSVADLEAAAPAPLPKTAEPTMEKK
jgi:hypothetical protein